MTRKKKSTMQWYKMDLHLHTPASADWQEPGVSYLDLLHKAEMQGLDIVAFTDHNTVAGCAALQEEIEKLDLLKQLGRIQPDEQRTLDEFRRIGNKVLVLPGFEFTATLGFHVLGVFPPTVDVRTLEHLLLELNVPASRLDEGATEVGATADVLTAYRVIDEAGGLAIAAHANSSHGVALRGLDFGGQTRIAYTQDRHLHTLEVTDLEKGGHRTTAWFFSGRKPEYPRRMHCIQGSDAHRLNRHPKDRHRLGWGDRITEILLPEPSFDALKAAFLGDDFARTRPYHPAKAPFDHVQAARDEGPSIVQSFHESMTKQGGRLHAILRDVVAMANTNGGTVYVGVRGDPKALPVGIADPEAALATFRTEIPRMVTPPLEVELVTVETHGRKVIQMSVPRGSDIPYAIDGTNIYVRQESQTSEAMRDEIVALVKQTLKSEPVTVDERPEARDTTSIPGSAEPPGTGVQILETIERKGTRYHTLKDLRNGNVVQNVTRSSARKLWRYAITELETKPVQEDQVQWQATDDRLGLWTSSKRAGKLRYDLVQRMPDGQLHIYYGVTEDGISGPWRLFIEE
ncbi:RNA-binding domain-containing protein [Chloroflexota bacterium]